MSEMSSGDRGLTTVLYREPRLLLLVVGLIAALAAAALATIARQEDPSITNLFATVVTPFPGAEPSRVEALVTDVIETELRGIAEVREISSVSRTGVSLVQVELSDRLSDDRIEQIWSEVRDALADAAVRFPPGVPEPELDNDRTGAFTAISALMPRDGVAWTPAVMRRYAELLQDRLRALPNTKLVRLFGEPIEEVRVTVDPDRLADIGIGLDVVAATIAAADAKVRAGDVRGSALELVLELDGEIRDAQRVRDIPLAARDGATVRLGDVATVERTDADPPSSIAYADGRRAVLVAAKMEDDRQVDQWAETVRRTLAAFEAELPGGIEHRLLFDQSRYTDDRLSSLGLNLAIGMGLVVLVLFVSLGWRAATVVTMIIPLATALSLAGMQWSGLTVHQMSVTGLIVALGLLVDAAIVMVDEIRRRMIDGMSRTLAISVSVRRLAVPLLASTATTVLAFLPMALLPGPAGDFVGAIALAVIIMLTVSLLLALTVAPALAGFLLTSEAGKGPLASGLTIPVLGRLFERSLDLALRNKGVAILGALTLPLMGFAAFPTLTSQFFPGVDRDQLHIQLTLPSGAAIAETDRLVRRLDALLRAEPEIAQVDWVIGESAPSFYYNMRMDRDGVPGFAEALVTTASADATERLIGQLQALLDQAAPDAQVIVRGLVQGPPVNAPVELRFVGPDPAELRRLGDEARLVTTTVPGVVAARTDLEGGAPKLLVTLDEQVVRQLGLTLSDVARQMDAALSGGVGGSLVEGTEALAVRVRLPAEGRDAIDDLRGLIIVPPAIQERPDVFPGVPLTALGSITLVPSDSPIARRNGERVNTVQAFIVRDLLPEEVLVQVRDRIETAGLYLAPGYRLEVGGDSDARDETTTNLAATAGLVLTLTIVTIVLTFRSYRLSLVTVLVAGLSMGLSLLALAVFGYPFGIQALIGTIGAIGVSVNAAIIVLTASQEDEAAMAGDVEAMRRVVTRSARHIVSTTITTVGGFVPLILAGGGFWPPFAMAIAGGVSLSMVLAFWFTPPMFALLMRPGRRRRQALATPATEGSGPFTDALASDMGAAGARSARAA